MGIILLLIMLVLSGCTSYTQLHRDESGKIYKVESYGSVKTIIKEEGIEIEQDSKNEPLIKFPDLNLLGTD